MPIYLWSLITIYLFTYCKNKALNKLKILLNIEEVFFYFRDRKCIMTMIWKIKKIEFNTLKEKWCNIMKFINKLWQRQSRKLNSNVKLCQNKIWLILYNLNTEFFLINWSSHLEVEFLIVLKIHTKLTLYFKFS